MRCSRMIKGVGVDIVEIGRVEKAIASPRFLQRVYTTQEQAYIRRRGAPSAAGMFCAKEAAMKALGRGIGQIRFDEIEVCHHPQGGPYLQLHGTAAVRLAHLGAQSLHVSISHAREYATATVLLEGK